MTEAAAKPRPRLAAAGRLLDATAKIMGEPNPIDRDLMARQLVQRRIQKIQELTD
jgi:hypothetical protein